MNRYSYKNLNVYQDAKAFVGQSISCLIGFRIRKSLHCAIKYAVQLYLSHLILQKESVEHQTKKKYIFLK